MAASAAAGLPSVSSCLDAAVLARTARVPAELRSTVAELERRLQRITAQRLAGDHAGALARSQALLPEAVAGGWLPLVAQVRLEIGVAQTEHGWYELARRTLEEAFVDATSAGDELGMAESATKLTHLVGHALGQAGQSRVWGRVAAALLARLGLAGSVRGGTLLNSLGSVALKQSAHDEALEYYQRALVIHETALGERHPTVATTLNNIATVLRLQGRYAESLAPYRRGLEIREAVQGPDHPALAYHLHGLGLSHLALGDLAAARVELERAVALRETAGEAAKLAASRLGLAKVLYAGDERARARELGAAARDGFREAGPGSEADLARAEAWLREHAE